MLIGITFAVLTWVLLYGRAGGIGGLITLLGALSYPVSLWLASLDRRRVLSAEVYGVLEASIALAYGSSR
jgi:hypothetical protein